MIGEILGKALVVVKGDTAHARAEIAKLSAAEQAAAKARVKAQEESNAAFERSNQKFGLYVAGATAGLALVSSSVKKYEEHLKSLGASGEEELKKLQNVTGSLSKAQDNLQIAIGKVAMIAAPAALELAKMANALARIVSGAADLVNAAKNIKIGGTSVGDVVGDVGDAVTDYMPGPLGDLMGGGRFGRWAKSVPMSPMNQRWLADRTAAAAERIVRDVRDGLVSAVVSVVEGKPKKWTSAVPDRSGPGRPRRTQGDAYADLGSALYGLGDDALFGLNQGVDWLAGLDMSGRTTRSFGGDTYARTKGSQREISGSLDALMRELEGEQAAKRTSMLESIFGPIEEFELYRTAWQGLEGVVTAGLNAWIDGSKSVSAAMKEALSAQAKQLAGEALLQTLRHGAFALGSLAFGRVDEAAKHGIAAAKWGAVLAVAGTYAKASAPGAGTANANAAAGLGGGTRGGDGGRRSDTTLVFGDAFSQDSPQYVARRTRRNLDNARLYADYLEDA